MSRRTVCLRKLGGNRAGEMRFGRFLHNQAVTAKEMIATAAGATGARAAGRHVLAIQDTTEINFQAHVNSKPGFGTVGNGTDIGLLLHPLVAVDAGHGGIIGLAGAEIINRTEGRAPDRKTRPLAEKESQRWLSGMERARAVLHGADQVTVVGDRESDIFGLFAGRGESLAALAWIAGRLGGWSGYTSKGYKPAGPKTMHGGLRQLQARQDGWNIAKCCQNV